MVKSREGSWTAVFLAVRARVRYTRLEDLDVATKNIES
jgi:hypothetical protein